MENLSIPKDQVLKLYKDSTKPQQALIEKLFGRATFAPNIMELVQTPDGSYTVLGRVRSKEVPFPKPKTERQTVANARFDLDTIAEALQQDWIANYDDTTQGKWYPVFKKEKGGGFVVSAAYYDGGYARTYVGARLCFPTETMALYFGRQFIKLHNIVLLKTNN